jgi:Kef-type K+ transport system membrane component KefB
MSFTALVIVAAVGFAAPLLLGLAPRVRVPAIVMEIVGGIIIGPAGLGLVTIDQPVRVLSVIGFAFLLFLSGLELDFGILRGPRLVRAVFAFACSCAIAAVLAAAMKAAGLVESVPLVATILVAAAIGMVMPVLKDAGEIASDFGQLNIALASIADFGTVLLLSFFFSREVTNPAAKAMLIGAFVALTAVAVIAIVAAEHWRPLGDVLIKLQDSTAQIRIRGAFLLLVAFAALAERLGLELVLGAFVAGALLSVLDRDWERTHPKLHEKLEAIGFGVFIPIFFVATGVQFDARALVADVGSLARVPIYFLALWAVRGLPSVLFVRPFGARRAFITSMLQATSLPFIVASARIGVELKLLTPTNAAALIAAGLLSVLIFPAMSLSFLKSGPAAPAPAASV